MAEKVVASANGYYVFECSDEGAQAGRPRYEVRQGSRLVKRYADLREARAFIEAAFGRNESNYEE
ncbi:hypothetical protein [Azotobacter salinestris]|uniref:hypothetical protein n=1 Tax=Azotobacter salinestris TaxID=69964 RepID=UPI0032E03935